MTDEELAPFLSGEMGIPCLDLAREFVAMRLQLGLLQEKCSGLTNSALSSAASAELAWAQLSTAKEQLRNLCQAMSNLSTQFLGE